MTTIVADTSAIIAYLRFEPGAEQVAACLSRIRLAMVNVAELVAVMSRHKVSRRWIEENVLRVFPDILPFDLDQAFLCGELEAATRSKGLSLGDRACLAAGLTYGWPVLTAEARWAEIEWKAFGYQPDIGLIRTQRS